MHGDDLFKIFEEFSFLLRILYLNKDLSLNFRKIVGDYNLTFNFLMNFILLVFHKPLSKEDSNKIYLLRENWKKNMIITFGKESVSNPNSHVGSHFMEDFQFGLWANLNEKIYEHKHKFSKQFILRSNLNINKFKFNLFNFFVIPKI
jgi:hypothetical protein